MYSLHDLNYQIIEYLKKEKVLMDKQMDTQTDRQTELPLVHSSKNRHYGQMENIWPRIYEFFIFIDPRLCQVAY